jgi:[protein-PII] uridylyltransferase
LLHDLGKARAFAGSDHSEAGAPIARRIADRWGFDDADSHTIEQLVRHHLLLARLATSRDVDDPATVASVDAVVCDLDTLDLLAALTVADARASGPQAASAWRLALIDRLVRGVRAHLTGTQLPPPALPAIEPPACPDGVGVRVDHDPGLSRVGLVALVVAVPDRAGALAAVAGVLSLAGAQVRQATVQPGAQPGMGVSRWLLDDAIGIDPIWVRERVLVALRDGGQTVARRLSRRAGSATDNERAGWFAVATPVEPSVQMIAGGGADATVLEVRADDRPGLLYRVCRALADGGANLRSAHIGTLGGSAVDVFYVTDHAGRPFDEAAAQRLAVAIQAELVGPRAGPVSPC